MERPAVLEMLDYMKEEGISTIIFTKLDRAFRSVRDCVLTLDQWSAEGIFFHIIEQKIDTSNAMGRAFLQIMAVLAELENGQRSERQRAASASAVSDAPRVAVAMAPSSSQPRTVGSWLACASSLTP